MSRKHNKLEIPEDVVRARFVTLVRIYEEEFLQGLEDVYSNHISLSKELLHCAITAYFDDIYKYKLYAGSVYADHHKQAAYMMLWITRFKPIQLKETVKMDTFSLTINEAFAVFVGLTFLNERVSQYMSANFYRHLIYTLVYRNMDGKGLASLLYLMEKAAQGSVDF